MAPSPPPVMKPVPPSSSPPSTPPPKPAVSTTSESSNVVTLEFQRQKAKELQDYFKQKKLDAANEGPFFGFIPKNEISNGRYLLNLVSLAGFAFYFVIADNMLILMYMVSRNVDAIHVNVLFVYF